MLHTHTFIYSSIHDCHNLILAMTQINTLNFVTTLYTKRYAADTQNTYFNKLPYQTAWFTTSVCCTHDTHYILAFLQGTDSHLLYMTLWSATHNIHLIRAEIKSQPKALCPPPPPPPAQNITKTWGGPHTDEHGVMGQAILVCGGETQIKKN